MGKHLLVGCSFTDPLWQDDIPWSVEYSKHHPCYIIAKAGMGIKGITTEALAYLAENKDITRIIMILPDLIRMDIELDEETYLANAMVDLLYAQNGKYSITPATRKWLVSGGPLSYQQKSEEGKIFDFLYKHQGFLVLAKENIKSLTMLINYCKINNIEYYISSIEDPLYQLQDLTYIHNDITDLLKSVEYDNWFRFNGKFIDGFLGHRYHPTTEEHQKLCRYIINNIG